MTMRHPAGIENLPRTTGFDFLVGEWTVDNERLAEPLSGRTEWYTTKATAVSTTLHNGAISVDEMWYPEAGFAGTSFRCHHPDTDEWVIYWVNSTTGHLQPPVTGRWSGAHFTAYGPDEYAGRPIQARYYWHSITPTAATWEQAFSADNATTWETNWKMHWHREKASPA